MQREDGERERERTTGKAENSSLSLLSVVKELQHEVKIMSITRMERTNMRQVTLCIAKITTYIYIYISFYCTHLLNCYEFKLYGWISKAVKLYGHEQF